MLRRFVLIFVAVAALPATALSQGVDPHAIYEDRCAGCHAPHSRDLVVEMLELRGADLFTKGRGQPLDAFLQGHRRTGLSPVEIDALLTHFSAILQSGGIFRDKCTPCHERARELARSFLVERQDRIVGRYSGRDIEAFLAGHGRLEAEEVKPIVEMFARQIDNLKPSGKP